MSTSRWLLRGDWASELAGGLNNYIYFLMMYFLNAATLHPSIVSLLKSRPIPHTFSTLQCKRNLCYSPGVRDWDQPSRIHSFIPTPFPVCQLKPKHSWSSLFGDNICSHRAYKHQGKRVVEDGLMDRVCRTPWSSLVPVWARDYAERCGMSSNSNAKQPYL